jgi:hypothetical protein
MVPQVRQPSARAAIIDAVLNAAVPTLVYQIAHHRGASDVLALGLAAIFPAIVALVGIVWRRTLDPIAGIVLFGLAVSACALAVGGDARVLLVRESFVTGALGLTCFASLFAPRPLMYYFGRWFATQGEAEAMRTYDLQWANPRFRAANRRITLVWAVAFSGEFALRVAMALTLPTVVVLAAGPLVLAGITIATLAWTFSYARRLRARYAAEPT